MTKILLGVPLFFLLFIVNVKIRFKTEEFEVNAHQVLAASAQTGKQLRLHRPSRFASLIAGLITGKYGRHREQG